MSRPILIVINRSLFDIKRVKIELKFVASVLAKLIVNLSKNIIISSMAKRANWTSIKRFVYFYDSLF